MRLYFSSQAIDESSENGPLLGYRIKYRALDGFDIFTSGNSYRSIDVDGNIQLVNLTELHPWQVYEVKVYAYNVIGESEEGRAINVRTLPMGKYVSANVCSLL